MSRQLGQVQAKVLDHMNRDGGRWFPGCGWLWNTLSGTVRIMQSLEARGLVSRSGDDPRTARWDVVR